MLTSFSLRSHAGRLIAAMSVSCLLAPVAGAQTVREEFWVAHGSVNAITVSFSNTVYIGGSFSSVGPASGGGVPLSAASGEPAALFPKVAGIVWAVASDGAGGWYLGGEFKAIGGVPRHNLGHVLADGSVAAWNPGSSNQVLGLAVSGSTVYAARIIGALAIDAATGVPVAGWNPPSPAGGLTSVAADGSRVYLGGFNGYLAALDPVTGAAVWIQSVTGSSPTVYALASSGTTLYVGGRFTGIGGQPRNRIAALDPATGALTAWDPNADFNVYALALDGSTVYAAGGFLNIGGQPRSQIAALDATTGAATAWDPNAAGGAVFTLATAGSTVYAGGRFTTMGGQARNRIAALDAATGAVTAWNPNANSEVRALVVSGSTVYAGGLFSCMGGWLARNNLAALDGTTGAATAWDPGINGAVSALAAGGADGSTIYVGGSFTNIGGQARNNIAALDGETGAATAWDPNASGGSVFSFAFGPNTVYAGGSFTNIGGQARNRIAALDATTGAATSWNPNADNAVVCLAELDVVYAAGDFTSIGGQARSGIAALDAATGAATAWNPNATGGTVSSLSIGVHGEVAVKEVYVGGSFTSIGGQARNHLASLDPATGAATTWDPAAADEPPDIRALEAGSLTIYVGGHFIHMNGQVRNSIAALDVTGAALDWDPNSNADATVYALATYEGTLYVGGSFDSFGDRPQQGIAAISGAIVSVPEAHAAASLELAQNRPNPAGTSTLIEFTLPAAAPVRLAVFDLLGRRVASLLDGEMRPAGANRVPFRPAGLAGGLYLYRLEALGRAVSRKMVIVE